MATRKKAPTTLLKEANARIEELESKLKSSESTTSMYREHASKAEGEIESIHAALDTLEVPRQITSSPNGYCSTKELNISSRLFAWVAGAKVAPQEGR